MKNLRIRLAACFICSAMLVASLASCANSGDDQQTVVDPNQVLENESNTPTFVEADFDGDTFTILSAVIDVPDFSDNYIDNEEMNGEPINDAVIDRNLAVEEKYNVDVQCRDEGVGYAAQAEKSGTVDFEVVYDWGIRLVPSATEGYFYDFNQIADIDLSQSYWAPSTHNDLTIADKMLIATNDISMNRLGYASFIIFNKRLCDDYGIEYPYELVNTNQWTVDKLYELIIKCGTDTNGDTLWGVEDVYGFGSGNLLDTAVDGSGLPTEFLLKNEDGSYTLNIYTEKLTTIYDTYADLAAPAGTFCDLGWEDFIKGRDISMYDSQFQAGRVFCFGEGHTVFDGTSMSYLGEFSNMTDQYGLVPNPKYEASQAEYYHYIDTCAPMFAVIKQADMEFAGIILEYMSYQSEQKLLPAYYEQTIKTKQTSDVEGRDEKMLDIVRDSVHYSWTGLYYQSILDAEGNGWDPCSTIKGEMLAAGNFASVNKRYKSAAETSINNIYELILEMDVNK